MASSKIVHVVPAEGLKVINPRTMRPIPAGGIEVVIDKYYSRRIAEGSLVVGKKPSASASVKKSKSSGEKEN